MVSISNVAMVAKFPRQNAGTNNLTDSRNVLKYIYTFPISQYENIKQNVLKQTDVFFRRRKEFVFETFCLIFYAVTLEIVLILYIYIFFFNY